MVYVVSFAVALTVCMLANYCRKENYIFFIGATRDTAVWQSKEKNISKLACICLSIVPSLLISCFRSDIGTDYKVYTREFSRYLANGINSYAGNQKYEEGFFLFARFTSLFSHNGQAIIISTSILFAIVIIYLLYNYSNDCFLSMYIFICSFSYFISLNNIRQSIASAFGTLALIQISNKQYVRAIISIAIASSFHQIALLYLIFFLAAITKFSALFEFVISLILYGVIQGFGNKVLDILPSVLERFSITSRMAVRLSYFINSEHYAGRNLSRTIILLNVVMMLIFTLVERRLEDYNKRSSAWRIIKMNQMLLIISSGFEGIIPVNYRIVRLFMFPQFILLPLVEEDLPKQDKQLYKIVILAFWGMTMALNWIAKPEGVFPYQSIF